MSGQPILLMQFLLAAAIGGMLALAVSQTRARERLPRWIGVMFHLGGAAYAFRLLVDLTPGLVIPPAAELATTVLSIGSIGWFHLFVLILFADRRRLEPVQFLPTALLSAVGVYDHVSDGGPILFLAVNALVFGLLGHAMFVLWRGWKGDLVEPRRRMRGPFLAFICAYIVTIRVFENFWALGVRPDWWPLLDAAILSAVAVFAPLLFLEPRAALFGPAAAPAAPLPEPDRAVLAELDRLRRLMDVDEAWREEGLTVASLALRVGVPEARLRRLIGDHLGHRNFPAFVNASRIAAACARLSDPGEARTSISAIAFDTGFGSLGPFNRAFREATGQSPSEWRREALAGPVREAPDGSPIPESA